MTLAHQNYLESIRNATKERPFAVGSDFLDMLEYDDPVIFGFLQQEIKEKKCLIIPAGYQLAEV
jgi:hypothetical protein